MDKYLDKIDSRFEEYIDSLKASEKIKEAVKYSFLNGGKRLRFQLYIALLKDFQGLSDDLIDIAIAIEMIHTYSLIHDDLPAMDNDDIRRGKPSNHIVFGDDLAILAGDALLTHSFDLIAKSNLSSDIKVLLIKEFVRCAGIDDGMINGQVLDIQNENNINISLSELENIHLQKTARLIYLPLYCATVITKRDEKVLEMKGFADKLGLYYQIQDDYLDIYGDVKELGKNSGSDKEKGKKTYVDFYNKEELEDKLSSMQKELLVFTESFPNLSNVISIIISRRS